MGNRKSISHKEICEWYATNVLKSASPNVNSRELKVDYAIRSNGNIICIEAESLTESESHSDLHIIGHLVTLALQNHRKKNIAELHWLLSESQKTKFKEKATMYEIQLRELIRSELFPKQIFKGIPKGEIDRATR